MKQRIIATLAAAIVITLFMLGVRHIDRVNEKYEFKKIELKDNSAQLKILDSKYDEVLKQLDKKDADKKKIEEDLKQIQNERDKLKQDLEAKLQKKEADRLAAAANAVKTAVQPPKAYAASTGCNTGNMYKDFIYMHESGCNPASVNSIGCRGIGQACPGTKLPCGADFACQDAYFTNYAIQRYGSWENAYAFWKSHNWW